MTIREQLIKRRDEVAEFFSWRFGTKRWSRVASHLSGLSRTTVLKRKLPLWCDRPGSQYVLTGNVLLRLEKLALDLGFKPDKPIDVSKQPMGLPRDIDPELRKQFYFAVHRERKNENERKAKIATSRVALGASGVLRRSKRPSKIRWKYRHLYLPTKLPLTVYVDTQGVSFPVVQDGQSSNQSGPLRKPRGRKAPERQEPNQLTLGLDV